MDWIDLSPYNMKLYAVDLPGQNGERGPRILLVDKGDSQQTALTRLGFFKHPSSGYWVHMGADGFPTPAKILEVMPSASIINNANMTDFHRKLEMPTQQANNTGERPVLTTSQPNSDASKPQAERVSAPKQEVQEVQAPPRATTEEIMSDARYLGMNRLGNKVYQSSKGRFLREGGSYPLFEGESNIFGPALFLRGTDPNMLPLVAEGFAEEVTQGKVMRYEDFRRFTNAALDQDIPDGDPRIASIHASIEGAMARWLVRNGGKSARDTFFNAVKLHDNHPYIGDLTRHNPDIVPLPLPVAVAAQRALGTEDDMKGKNIVITGKGSASLLSCLPKNNFLTVYESNAADAGHARQSLESTGRKDSLLIQEAPNYTNADMVIASYERGILDEPRKFTGGLTTMRSDLAEMAASLEARNADGRSVYILRCGDTPEEREDMDRVRAWIASRWYIEGCADIDGSMHTGRPEANAMRIFVVGKARKSPLPEAPDVALRIRDINEFASLWTWTAEVVSNRAKIEDYVASIENGLDPNEAANENLEENNFQTPYVSASAVGQTSTMVPKNLEGATREALGRIAKKRVDIDQWVANELAMSKEQLSARFSPEQVDAIAMAIDAEERGRSFLNADMTGMGKGRVLAALMRRAALQGRKSIFLTEREINISDIMRDIRHIGAEGEFSILILNDGAEAVDEMTGNVVASAPKRATIMEIMETREWPAEYNLIIATYSQFNRPGEVPEHGGRARNANQVQLGPKSLWLRNAIDDETLLLADESHNAASGASNVSKNIAAAVKKAGSVVFSSATFAKKAKNMGIYAGLFPSDFDTRDLTDIIRRGGTAIQETLSAMLVKDGVMIRREHDLSRCEFRIVSDTEHEARNREQMDRLAPVLAEMAYLSGDLKKRITVMNDRIEAEIREQARARDRVFNEERVNNRVKSMQVSRIGFGSPLYNLSRLFVASLNVDMAADRAVAALRENRKPVILVDNTIQGVLEEIAASQAELDIEDGRPDGEIPAGVGAVEGEQIPSFKHLLHRTLRMLTRATRKTPNGPVVEDLAKPDPVVDATDRIAARIVATLPPDLARADELSEEERANLANWRDTLHDISLNAADADESIDAEVLATALERVRGIINNLPDNIKEAAPSLRNLEALTPGHPSKDVRRIANMIDALPDLPSSAIDAVRDRITEAGFTCEEITGRSLEFKNGRVTRREASRKVDIKNRFNAGLTDALIINTSGATGIDLHAGSRFADQRQREMIVLQESADPTKLMQALGRVNRFDQVVGPIITTILAGMPIELRLLAMRNAKLRALSANVTSSRENATLLDNIPDLMNAVGDMVCSRYAEARPDLMRRLGFEVERNEEVEAQNIKNEENRNEEDKDNTRSANEILARLAMLPIAMQIRTLEELEAEYHATIQELDATGTNPLKNKVIDGVVHLRERQVVDGADVKNLTSEFYAPVFAQDVIIEHAVAPMRSTDLLRAYERGLALHATLNLSDVADRLQRNRERLLQAFLPLNGVTVAEAIEVGTYKSFNAQNEKLTKLIDSLHAMTVGSSVKFHMDGVVEEAIVTRIEVPDERQFNVASRYIINLAAPGWINPMGISLQTLMSDEAFAVDEGLNGPNSDAILRRFDDENILNGARLEKRTLLTGNPWSAMNMAIKSKLGNMVTWKGTDGVNQRAVLVSKRINAVQLLPVPLRSPAMISAAAAEKGIETIYGDSELSAHSLTIRRKKNNDNIFVIKMPRRFSKKHGAIYEHEPVVELLRLFNTQQDEDKTPVLEVTSGQLPVVLKHLIDGGASFYVPSKHRNWSTEWMATNYAQHEDEQPEQGIQLAAA